MDDCKYEYECMKQQVTSDNNVPDYSLRMHQADNLEYNAEQQIRLEISQNLQSFSFIFVERIMLSDKLMTARP